MIERFDADNDGVVTLEEFMAGDDRFEGADADADGFVTEQEIIARASDPQGRRIDRIIGRMDTDEDGKISLDEAKAAASERAEQRFARADADEDGFVTGDEARALLDDRRSRRMARRGERGRDGRGRHHRHHEKWSWHDDDHGEYRRGDRRGGRDFADRDDRDERRMARRERREERRAARMERRAERMAARMLSVLDTNGDDKISKAEADARLETRFAQFDGNDDGKVTAEELQDRMARFGRRGMRTF